MCQKASIQHSFQPRSNDPCVDPCVVSRLTLPLFPVQNNQSIVCLLVSLPLFRSFPLIWFSFFLFCIFFSLCVSVFEPYIKFPYLHLSLGLLYFLPLLDKMHRHFTVMRFGIKDALIYCLTYQNTKIHLGEECTFQTWQLSY